MEVAGMGGKVGLIALRRVAPRRTRASSSAATEQLQECFAQADRIASEKLDNLVVQFEASEPTFFSEFEAARRIGQAAARSVKEKQGTLALPIAA